MLQILVILLALGPLFALEVPFGPVLPIFVEHVIKHREGTYAVQEKSSRTLANSLKSLVTVIQFMYSLSTQFSGSACVCLENYTLKKHQTMHSCNLDLPWSVTLAPG